MESAHRALCYPSHIPQGGHSSCRASWAWGTFPAMRCLSCNGSSSHNVFCDHTCPIQSTQANEHLLGLASYSVSYATLLPVVVNYTTRAQLSTAEQAKHLRGHLLLSAPNLEVNTIYQTLIRPSFLPALG